MNVLRRGLLVTAMATVPIVALGCGEGLAGNGTDDGGSGGGGDANFGQDAPAPTSDGSTGPAMDATSMDAAQGHDGAGPPNEGGGGPHGEAGEPDASDGGSCGTCASGRVCCEPPLGCAGMCVPDCRQGGTCPNGLTCDENTGVCSPGGDGGMMPPPDGGMMPPPDGGMMPPPDGGMRPPPDGGMHAPPDGGMRPPPDGGMMPPPDGGMMPPPDAGSSSGGSDAGDGSGAVQPGIGVVTGDGNGTYPPYSGNNVSIDDTTIVLGNSQLNCISGHASVYVWDGVSSWQVQQTFDDPANDGFVNCFGGSTTVLGDVAFVSAPQTTNYEGIVYEYTRSGTTWTEASSIADTSLTGSVADFGYSIAYDGTHLIAGAPAVQSNGTTYIGRVDVLIKQGPDWNVQKEIYAPVQTGAACFGTSVAMNGTRLAVGANGGPQQAYSVAGATYTYQVSGTTWTYEASAIGTDTQATDGFGQSVALASATGSPDLLIAGAPAAGSPVASQSGAAYVFYFDSGNDQWVQSAKLYASDGATGDRFGYTVGAISSKQVVVGSPNPSKAYLFTFSGSAWSQTTIYQSCPQTIGWNMATWGSLLVTGKANDVVIDTSPTSTGDAGGQPAADAGPEASSDAAPDAAHDAAIEAAGDAAALCALTDDTTPTATVNSGCALRTRDTSSCAAARTAQGLGGFWQKFSCRVTLTVQGSAVQITTDDQPDYTSNYFAKTNPCYTAYGTSFPDPNTITAQHVVMTVPLAPSGTGQAMSLGAVGVALNGVEIFDNQAAPGDSIFTEIGSFDECQGHPQMQGVYHYHSEPYAISYDDDAFIGVMRDGNPIYGRHDPDGSTPTLDASGGHTGVTVDSPSTPVYHYHLDLQTSTSGATQGQQAWFLTTGQYANAPGTCSGC